MLTSECPSEEKYTHMKAMKADIPMPTTAAIMAAKVQFPANK